jgi:predicted NAD/FAD-binding protein
VTRRKIAVIGSGVSGITAGYVLSHTDYVTIFEADGRLGGHADTHLVVPPSGPPVGVDTGFIVYNERTYPLLTRLFAELGVATQPAEMSMSVRCAGCGLQYAGHRGLAGLTPGLRQGGARYLHMLTEIPRFHRAARRLLAAGNTPNDQTLGEFLRARRFGAYFTAHFALPLVAAVWSCPPGTALRYPARYLFAFLANHGMLSVRGAPPWRTVTGGSRAYVEKATKRVHDIKLSTPVRAVRRYPDGVERGVELTDAAGETHRFDAVVIATHPDQALRLLDAPTPAERDVLGAFAYTPNPALLHTDATLLPPNPGVRASWNYELGGCRPGDGPAPRISYDMNRLQSLPVAQDYIVTLGGTGGAGWGKTVDPGQVIDRMDYAHPAYTPASVAAQRLLPGLNTGVTAFAGAYHGWGFHEDGCRSGAQAAQALGGTW